MKPKLLNFHDLEYEAWVRDQPCLVCEGRAEVHHVWHARNNSYLTVPLCHGHHVGAGDSYHQLGAQTFQDTHSIDLTYSIINLLSSYINARTQKQN